MQSTPNETPAGHGRLGLWDAVTIIIGIVIGSSIFTTPTLIFRDVPGPWEGLGLWLLGGVLSLIGALCYAELATTYPRSGGDYVYLTRAFGRPVGFLFGWAQLAVILSGSTGAMAFIFGSYSANLFNVPEAQQLEFATYSAMAAVALLTLINFFGVVLGKWVQNLLVLVKVAGLLLIIYVGLTHAHSDPFTVVDPGRNPTGVTFGVAMILVLYAFGGWNDAAFVAADMRSIRDIPKALILGTVGITLIYLAVNVAYLVCLGYDGSTNAFPVIAGKVLDKIPGGKTLISVIVMISALGAMNGLIFTGSRVYSSLGQEHRVFALLGRWHPTLKAPIWSLLIQAAITLLMIFLVGTKTGRDDIINKTLTSLNIKAIPWDQYFGGFDTLFAGTAPVFWIFFLLTGLSMFVLRFKDPTIQRPFYLTVPWYPLLPLIFCGMCVFGLYSALNYAKWVSLIGFIPLAVGVPLYVVSMLFPGTSHPPADKMASSEHVMRKD
jgi:amino acid transporter